MIHLRTIPLCLFILPMRNWNKGTVSKNTAQHHFLSYLWGIEIRMLDNGLFLIPAFYPTYEELKYSCCFSRTDCTANFLSYLWGIEIKIHRKYIAVFAFSFYPTYEELKYRYRNIQYRDAKSFYPTYEELKYIPGLCAFAQPFLFILPMRNWNVLI